ncbi:hypothetical protein JZU48_02960, partial [bacterium]|nr:hypothetical protein [bacterium]
RREDIPAIADGILERLAILIGPPTRDLSACAVEALQRYDWPGNVRELHNVLERALAQTDDYVLTAEHIAAALPIHPEAPEPKPAASSAAAPAEGDAALAVDDSTDEVLRLQLDEFEGPFEVLLYLIKEQEI